MRHRSILAALLLLLFAIPISPVSATTTTSIILAGCGFNPFCHIGNLLTAILPKPTVNVNSQVQVGVKVENVDELQGLINSTFTELDQALSVAGGETRQTIEKARSELSAYTREVDALAGRRIADLDARLQAKLLWIQQYTEQVSREAQTIIAKLHWL